MERIDRLETPIQVLLQMAAVLGTRFSAPLLRRMYALEPAPMVELDAWLAPYRRLWSDSLDDLERHLDQRAKEKE